MVDEYMCKEPLSSPVRLIDDASGTGLHFFLEKFVFANRTAWKNEPRTNFLFLRAMQSVALTCALALLVPTIVLVLVRLVVLNAAFSDLFISAARFLGSSRIYSLALGFLGAVSVVFWNLRKQRQGDLAYCFELYNKYIFSYSTDSDVRRAIQLNALAIDLLYSDLWAHWSLKELFAEQLETAVRRTQSEHAADRMLEEIKLGRFRETAASRVLHEYQSVLLNKLKQTIPSDASENQREADQAA